MSRLVQQGAHTLSSRPSPHPLKPSIGLAGIGLVTALGTPAVAQDAQAPTRLPELSISGAPGSPFRPESSPVPRSPVTAEEMPQTVNIVPRVVIEERAASTVREALRNVTGISLAAGEGGFSGDNLTLRGFSARSDFFIDGIRDFGQYTRDTFFLEEVQVLKGPSSVMFGRGSTGGVIEQRSRLPLPTTQGEVWLSAYTPSGVRSTTDVNIRAGDVAARFAAMGSRIDAAGRDEVFNERWGIFPSVTWGMDGPTQFTLSWLHQEERNLPDYGVPYRNGRPLRVSTNTFYGLAQTDEETTRTDVVTARLQHRVNENLTLRNTTRWANYGRDVSATAPRFAANNPNLVNRQAQVREGFDSVLVNQTEAVANVRLLGLRHDILAGFEVGRESSEATRFNQAGRPAASLAAPDFLQTGNIVTTFASDIKTTADTYAVYAVDRISIGEMFEVMIGGRYDSFEAEQSNRGTGQQFGRTDREATWRGALIFKPTPRIRTYVSAGTSFNPSAEALTLAANNANLPPETATTYEVGASFEVTEGLRLAGAAFRTEKLNARTSDPANSTLQVLDGEVRVDGVEVSLTGRILPGWNLLAGYTYLDSQIRRSTNAAEVGKEFANVPPHSASLWTSYDLPGGFQLGGGLSFVDRRFANTTNTAQAPSYTRFDAALAWAPTEGSLRGLRLQLNALNLGDARTYDTVYSGHVVPGVGRTFVASAAVRF
jgi:catecholate siderophore receptor